MRDTENMCEKYAIQTRLVLTNGGGALRALGCLPRQAHGPPGGVGIRLAFGRPQHISRVQYGQKIRETKITGKNNYGKKYFGKILIFE